MKQGEYAYGGKYYGGGWKYLFFWFSDFRKSTFIEQKYQIQIGSTFFNWIIKF